jgi:hypothetical protein
MLRNGLDLVSPPLYLPQGPKLLGAKEIKEYVQANITKLS